MGQPLAMVVCLVITFVVKHQTPPNWPQTPNLKFSWPAKNLQASSFKFKRFQLYLKTLLKRLSFYNQQRMMVVSYWVYRFFPNGLLLIQIKERQRLGSTCNFEGGGPPSEIISVTLLYRFSVIPKD